MVDSTLWMPKGLDDGEKAQHATANPGDPHGAAAAAWESWAAQLRAKEAQSAGTAVPGAVASVSTGAQSVTYDSDTPRTQAGLALVQAAWHRARASVSSVAVGPEFSVAGEGEYIATATGASDGVTDESNDVLWTSEHS